MKHIINYRLFESTIELQQEIWFDSLDYRKDNRKFSGEDITRLIDSYDPDQEPELFGKIASHPNLRPEDQARLLELSSDSGYQSRVSFGLTGNLSLSKDLIDQFSKSSSEIIRGNIAKNPIIDGDIAGEFSRDSDWFVRSMVALNPAIRTEDLYLLTFDPNQNVKECADFSMSKRNPIDELLGDF
jgi:hypothetical protein